MVTRLFLVQKSLGSRPSETTKSYMKRFIEFALIWYSQQMAIPFWVVGHIHLSINIYKDLHEIITSLGLNLLVAIGFIIDYRKTTKSYEKTTTTRRKKTPTN